MYHTGYKKHFLEDPTLLIERKGLKFFLVVGFLGPSIGLDHKARAWRTSTVSNGGNSCRA
jgi:hypothetical protein